MNIISKRNKLYNSDKCGTENEISNFDFEIVCDNSYIKDDGSREHIYQIQVTTGNGDVLPIIKVSAIDYDSGKWVAKLGSKVCVIQPNCFKKALVEKLRHSTIPQTITYSFVGFGKDEEGVPFYVDHGGLLSARGYDTSIKSEMDHALKNYIISAPTEDEEEVKEAIRAVFDFKNLTPNNPYIGLLGMLAAIRSIIAIIIPSNMIYFIIGKSGSRKTAIMALIQSFFGPNFADQLQISTGWNSTQAALEEMAIIIKTMLAIDEFTPVYGVNDRKMAERAEGLFRSVANGQTKQRANSNATLNGRRTPGAQIITTGESLNIAVAESLIKRIILFPIDRDDVDLNKLTELQKKGRKGVFTIFTASFISWFLTSYEKLKPKIENRFLLCREKAKKTLGTDLHARCHETYATMQLSLELLYGFAVYKGVITKDEENELINRDYEILEMLISNQEAILKEANPANLLAESIKSALQEGLIHVRDYRTGKKPVVETNFSFGWSNKKPSGECVGYFDKNEGLTYIESDLDINILLSIIPDDRKAFFPTSKKSFWKNIDAYGGLIQKSHGHNTVKRTDPLTGKTKNFYCMRINY